MQWLLENLPVVSSAFVAVSSVLISFMKLIRETDANSKKIRRLVDLANVYQKMSDDLKAKKDVELILNIETERFKTILTRKVNLINLAAVVIVSIIGGLLSYVFALWATNSWILFSVIAWILFGIVAFFTIGIAIVGMASIYQQDKGKDKK